MDIMRFRNTLKTIARPSTFDVTITGNPATQILDTNLIRFTCKSASLPSKTMGKIDCPYMDRKIPFLGSNVYDDWTTTIMCDKDITIYKQLTKWHDYWNHPVQNVAVNNELTAYLGDAYVIMYDPMGNSVARVKMVDIFPYQIQALELDWESSDQYAQFTVTWFITYFEIEQ